MARICTIFYFSCVIIIITWINNVYSQSIGLDRICMRDADCSAQDSECYNGICQCRGGTVEIQHPPRCLLVPKNKNDPCEDDMQCTEAFLLGSYCGESGRCDCYPGHHFKDNICMKLDHKSINDRCSTSTDCSSSVPGSYCSSGYCKCEEDKVPNKDRTKCLTAAKNVGDRCEDDEQCKGEPQSHIGLGLGSKCVDSKCQCLANYHFYDPPQGDGSCFKTAKIGEVCQSVDECTKLPDPSRMQCEGSCQCKHPYVESSDKTKCNGAATLGVTLSLLFAAIFSRFAH